MKRELSRPPDLPEFEHPPIIEVALSVQFEPLKSVRIAHLGLLWGEFRERYPRAQEQNPIANIVEQFGATPSPHRGVTLSEKPEARLWFLDEDEAHLVQVQRDRFARNWRGEGDHYPRYENIRAGFVEDYEKFVAFLEKEKLGSPAVTQVEVTYINHIFPNDAWCEPGEANHVFEICTLPSEPTPEDFGFGIRYLIPDDSGKAIGRLHVTGNSAFHVREKKQIFAVQLTARGEPPTGELKGILEFMDLGRTWIVRQFAALTTQEMHRVWKRVGQ